jgi:hypothetical protein
MNDAAAQKRQRDVIAREELAAIDRQGLDVYQAIRSLRPHFLEPPRGVRTMGAYATAPAVLYVDGLRQGEVESLKMMMVANVMEIRYLEPSKAQEEYGMSHSGGALLIKLTKSLPKPAARSDSGKPRG